MILMIFKFIYLVPFQKVSVFIEALTLIIFFNCFIWIFLLTLWSNSAYAYLNSKAYFIIALIVLIYGPPFAEITYSDVFSFVTWSTWNFLNVAYLASEKLLTLSSKLLGIKKKNLISSTLSSS